MGPWPSMHDGSSQPRKALEEVYMEICVHLQESTWVFHLYGATCFMGIPCLLSHEADCQMKSSVSQKGSMTQELIHGKASKLWLAYHHAHSSNICVPLSPQDSGLHLGCGAAGEVKEDVVPRFLVTLTSFPSPLSLDKRPTCLCSGETGPGNNVWVCDQHMGLLIN